MQVPVGLHTPPVHGVPGETSPQTPPAHDLHAPHAVSFTQWPVLSQCRGTPVALHCFSVGVQSAQALVLERQMLAQGCVFWVQVP